MRARIAGMLAAALLVVGVSAGPGAAASWRFEALPGGGSPDLGTAAVEFGGRQHVFTNSVGEGLRHLWWTGSTWNSEVLDGATSSYAGRTNTANIGINPFALLYAGAPHVWYLDGVQGNLHHAWWTGSTWQFELVDGPSSNLVNHATTSLYLANSRGRAFLYNGLPQVVYGDPVGSPRLRSAVSNGSSWFLFVLDGAGSPYAGSAQYAGDYSDVSFFGGFPHVFTIAARAGNFVVDHLWWDGAVWHIELLDGAGSAYGAGGATPDAVGLNGITTVSYGGVPHVWYQDFTTGALRHGWWTGSTWRFEVLDGAAGICSGAVNGSATVGITPQAVIFGGQPHVFHYRTTSSQAVRHAWWTGSQWRCEVLDGAGSLYPGTTTTNNVGRNVALLVGTQLDAWYQDATAPTLRHAWFG